MFLTEDREEDKYDYDEVRVKDVVDRVIVELSGSVKSLKLGRLARRYKKVNKLIDTLKNEEKKINVELKDDIQALFDVKDSIYTRVIKIASATLTLDKVVKDEELKNEVFDTDEFIKDVYVLFSGLTAQLDVLKDKHTELKPYIKRGRKPGLRVDIIPPDGEEKPKTKKTKKSKKKEESLLEFVADSPKMFALKSRKEIMNYLYAWDETYNDFMDRFVAAATHAGITIIDV